MPGSKPCPPGCECGRHRMVITPEHRRRIIEANRERYASEEFSRQSSERMRRRWAEDPAFRERMTLGKRGRRPDGTPAEGFVIWPKTGHIMLTMQQGHPLADRAGHIFEHRKVLYDEIGPGPHPCHWHPMSGCGNLTLEWADISVDHLDDDPTNNDLANLAVSCLRCNWGRSTAKWYRV